MLCYLFADLSVAMNSVADDATKNDPYFIGMNCGNGPFFVRFNFNTTQTFR